VVRGVSVDGWGEVSRVVRKGRAPITGSQRQQRPISSAAQANVTSMATLGFGGGRGAVESE